MIKTKEMRSRWSWRQRVKNDLLYGLMRLGFAAARVLPLRGFLRLVGCMAPHIFVSAARRARAQLTRLPELDAVTITRRMFLHFAESLWELSRLHRSVPKLDDAARRVLDDTLAEGKGAVLISGHIGNWELLGQAIAAAGYPIASIAKPSYDPRVTRWLQKWRTAHGLRIVWRDETNAGKSILSVLRSNGDGILDRPEHQNRRRLFAVLRTTGFHSDDSGSDRAAHGSPGDFLLASSPTETAQTEF